MDVEVVEKMRSECPMKRLWKLVVMGVITIWIGASELWAAEPVTPISALLVNPASMHRRVVRLEGVATNIATYSGSETGTNRSLCGADFTLEDATGKIDVSYHVRCQAGREQAAVVGEKMRVIVEGDMDAPPTVMRRADGEGLGFRVLAHTVTPINP